MYQQLSINLSKVPSVPDGVYYIAGEKVYIKKGKKDRLNGPAVERKNGYKAWYHDGVLDRKGKPAVIHPDGREEYWEKGKRLK